jgi:hypothetical protein
MAFMKVWRDAALARRRLKRRQSFPVTGRYLIGFRDAGFG